MPMLLYGNGMISGATSMPTNVQFGGSVGIGTTSPSQKLHVSDASGDVVSLITGGTGYAGYCVVNGNGRSGLTGALRMLSYSSGVAEITNDSNAGLLFGTNSTERMRIDSSGRVTKPYQATFSAGSTAGTHTTAAGSVMDWNSVSGTGFNNGSYFNTSTYAFTAPVSGYYLVVVHVYAQNGAGYKSIAFMKNGSVMTGPGGDAYIGYGTASNVGDFTVNSTAILYLSANDYIQTCPRPGNGSFQWYGGHSWFSGYLLG